MSKQISLNILSDSENLLNQIGIESVIDWIERKGYSVMNADLASKYVNIEKSMGTEPFYKLIVDAIEAGKLSLEMIVGHVATRKLMRTSEKIAEKIK